jgi:spore coat polysaccharide biosynthesis protein SpsF (cytidylyltransferase family)
MSSTAIIKLPGNLTSIVVRITADCPLIDPVVIDQVVDALFGGQPVPQWDFTTNRLPPPWKRSYPIGLDVEVCTFAALEKAWKEAKGAHQREHVMPYLYEQEGRFRVLVLDHKPNYGHMRWTVDTSEDLELIRRSTPGSAAKMISPGWRSSTCSRKNQPWLKLTHVYRRNWSMRWMRGGKRTVLGA